MHLESCACAEVEMKEVSGVVFFILHLVALPVLEKCGSLIVFR